MPLCRAFEKSAATFAAHPEALTFGPSATNASTSTPPTNSRRASDTHDFEVIVDPAPEGSAAAEGLKAAAGRERSSGLPGVKVDVAEGVQPGTLDSSSGVEGNE